MTADLLDLLERLSAAGVEFVIIGGFAGIVHGCTYVTEDIDICCDFSAANLLALQKALAGSHPVHRMTPHRKPLLLTEKTCRQFENLYLDTDIGQLDCVGSVEGVGDYQQVKQASEIVEVEDTRMRILKLDWLIKSKKATDRPRDRQAVLQLEAIKKLRRKK
ncbi:MAG: hypothetical protein JSU94_08740 [Phycisphaerales bacterium]|nr:MAG: hypothetical protein JSU94_08740 [Phycisphaerales bacterium]